MIEPVEWCDLLGYILDIDKELLLKGYRIVLMSELENVSSFQDEGLTPLETANKILYKRNMKK